MEQNRAREDFHHLPRAFAGRKQAKKMMWCANSLGQRRDERLVLVILGQGDEF
jgi:hypothetical protein